MNGEGKLYIVATPIGNLEDITLRALNTLKTADIIACEDTRRTSILASKYGIKKPMVSFFSYNQIKKTEYLLKEIKTGKTVALVSDAGTPGISDPGHFIIKKALEEHIPIESIPGPSAVINALVLSGKPTNKFVFEGFLSNKTAQRKKRLLQLKEDERTKVIYESPHRLTKCLQDIEETFGNVDIVCAREMTKKFEEITRTSVKDAIAHFTSKKPKGEFVIVV